MKLSRRDFLKLSAYSGLVISSAGIHGCSNDDSDKEVNVEFKQGVASGDPLTDSVVIWTRITTDSNKSVTVNWQVATDENFENLVNEDSASVSSDSDYILKVDVSGLMAGTHYFYRFMAGSETSPVGTTKTLPDGTVDSFSLAAISCSNFPAGYFHVYQELANNSDIDVILHLGDYIYEYGRLDENGVDPAYASEDAASLGREVLPETELLTLQDYRTRYMQYRGDASLQAAHAAHPFIVVWDDHEIANDSYASGAENHDSDTEGDFEARKSAAIQAYFEWMPIRPLEPDEAGRIYRHFEIGNLVNLMMLDTRILGRDQQLDYLNYINLTTGDLDVDGFTADVTSDQRTILGAEQSGWLLNAMSLSTATWQVLGQQVLMMKMLLPAVTLTPTPEAPTVSLAEYGVIATAAGTYQYLLSLGVADDDAALLAAGLTQEQLDIVRDATKMSYLQSPSIPYNLDAWDGYAYDREVLLATAKAAQKNLISLAGDTHNAWAGKLHDQDGDVCGFELATTSVSSPGLEEYLSLADAQEARETEAGVVQLVDALDYANVRERGYLTVMFESDKLTANWQFVSTIKDASYEIDASLTQSMVLQAGADAFDS